MSTLDRRILITGGSGFIGTNYIESLVLKQPTTAILNIDIRPPQIPSHNLYWKNCNILDFADLLAITSKFCPTEVIHLAAKTDTDSNDLDDYFVNTKGTENVLRVINDCANIDKVVITSTQYVKRPGSPPTGDDDYDPHTAYGESKVIAEKMTHSADLHCRWTIIRPTNIWGPWHPRYPFEFWRILKKGLYFHPSGRPAKRSYGYVENVVYQIEKILGSKASAIDKKMFYVGDDSIDLIDWVDGFSVALTGKKSTILPRFFIRSLALIGDALQYLNLHFPITSSRYESMTTDDIVPIERTISNFGPSPISLKEGIQKTVVWLERENHKPTVN